MTTMSHLKRHIASLAVCLALTAPVSALAQTIPYGDTDGAGDDATPTSSGHATRGGRIHITPYIEAAQVANAELSPGHDVLTYSSLAAGVDATLHGRNNDAALSLRYERRIGWGKTASGDSISGLARVATTIVPGALRLEAGGLATRSRVENNGSAVLSPLRDGDAVTQIYSVYAGPALATNVGNVALTGNYRIGYTRIDSPKAVALAAGQAPLDVFDDSIVHSAGIHAGIRAGDGLPVGIGVGGGFYQEDISNLDQRVRDMNVRWDVTLPVSSDVALVAGVGYEDVEISSRDALRDAGGNAVIGSDGRYVTDKSSPRIMAYDVSGMTWDAGVMWRPSKRTALEAHVGRRYGSTSVYGSFAYAPNDRSALNISVYDNVAGFGGQVNRALAEMPTDFQAVRNPLTGDLGGCVNSLQKGSCLSGVLGSVRSSTFRARGVMASYGHTFGRLSAGIGGGYDRRRFIAAPGTILAAANGKVDENYWLAGYVNGQLGERSSFSTNVYANWFQSGFASAGDGTAFGASAAYNRSLSDHLSATAALGIDGINRQALDDIWNASALVGVRYSF
jgi:hypothetical protein